MSTIPIESPGINVAVVRRGPDGWRFLLLQRAAEESYPGFWGLLTGGREGDESVPSLAIREMAEEIGLAPVSLWASEFCLQFYEPLYDKIWILPVLVAVVSSDAEVRLSSENGACEWLTAREAGRQVLWKNLKHVIRDISEELLEFPAPNWVKLTIEG